MAFKGFRAFIEYADENETAGDQLHEDIETYITTNPAQHHYLLEEENEVSDEVASLLLTLYMPRFYDLAREIDEEVTRLFPVTPSEE